MYSIPAILFFVYCMYYVHAGRILSRGGGGVLFKVRWTVGLLHNKTWMTEFAGCVLVLNLLNLRAFPPLV